MRIVVAPDKFKGSLSAAKVAGAIITGLREVLPHAQIDACPMADGGEGTVEAFIERGFERRTVRACGPLGDPVNAQFAFDGTTAVVEMASASGLVLIPSERRDPRRASTVGTGDLVRAALDAGARRIIVGIGGSATNDGGAGFAQALGARLYDGAGNDVMAGGAPLAKLARIDLSGMDPRLRDVEIEVASDVDNPLCGPTGASAIYGPQKGASPADIDRLDKALAHFADVVAATIGRDVRDVPGAGAAGGLGFGLMAFAGAKLRPGVELIAELVGLKDRLRDADLCVSGEGRIDRSTLHGKTLAGVAKICGELGIPLVALGGSVDGDAEHELATRGVTCVPITTRPMSLEEAVRDADGLIVSAAARLARLVALPHRSA